MASFKYNNVYLNDYYSLVGKFEKEGLLKNYDTDIGDFYYGTDTPENCEVKMQKVVIQNLLAKNKLLTKEIDLVIGGELSNQLSTSALCLQNFRIPFLGLYSACSTFTESLIVGSNFIDNKQINKCFILSSSHNLNAEKQFRYPIEYGCIKPWTNTFTITGAVAMLISNQKSKIKIESGTLGKVIDSGVKDVNQIGAIMARGSADTIISHLNELKRDINYYDLIVTGDLGKLGSKIFKEYLKIEYNIKLKKYYDAGTFVYKDEQNKYSGASGPAVLPIILVTKILKDNKVKKILLLGTGSLHSPSLVNQKNTIPTICHAVSLEVLK